MAVALSGFAAPDAQMGWNMRIRKCVIVLAAVTLPLASVVMLEGTAFAKKVTGTGAPTCHFGGTINFNPGLKPGNGSPASKEVVTVSANLTRCSGGSPSASPTGITVKSIKIKSTVKEGKTKYAGGCGSLASAAAAIVVKTKVSWSGEKPSKTTITHLAFGVNSNTGEADFTGSTATTGSYAGSGTVAVSFTHASTNALLGCEENTSSAPVNSASIDAANSTIRN